MLGFRGREEAQFPRSVFVAKRQRYLLVEELSDQYKKPLDKSVLLDLRCDKKILWWIRRHRRLLFISVVSETSISEHSLYTIDYTPYMRQGRRLSAVIRFDFLTPRGTLIFGAQGEIDLREIPPWGYSLYIVHVGTAKR